MSHVLTKLAAAGLIGVMAASCGDAEKRQAESMFVMAETAAQDGDYVRAVALVDSIDSIYPRQVEVRRKAMHLRATAGEQVTLAEIEQNSAVTATLKLSGDSLQALLAKVDHPLEPYFVAAGSNSIVGENGIEARMAPDGMFYLISSLKQPKVGHTYVSVSADGQEARTAEVAYDGERNDRSMGYEVVHYMMPECDSVGAFIASHPGELTLTYGGGSKPYTTKLDADKAARIATVWRAAANARDQRRAIFEQQRLQKQLELNRSHAARTFEE